jgi:subtilase family serine protease
VIHASVALASRDPFALAEYARAVTTPGSFFYHRYLSVAEFARRFGPTAAAITKVRETLAAQGLRPGAAAANRLTIPVSGTAGVASRAFSTSFERYRMFGRIGYANRAPAALSGGIAGLVQGVIGLDTIAPSAAAIVRPTGRPGRRAAAGQGMAPVARVAGPGTTGAQPCPSARSAGAGGAGYTANQIADAYGLSKYYAAGDQGRNVTIALYELEPYSASDVAAYQSCYGTSAAVTNVRVDGGAGAGAGSGEAAMDLEDVIGLAPKASIRVYEGPATGAGAYDTYSRIISDDSAQVISTSWGLCEALAGSVSPAAESTLFQEAAVQGQSLLAAAGDEGSDDCGSHQQSVDDPASQPWVTAVGGTSLRYFGDTVWNDGLGATGGGVSRLWARPAYQNGTGQPRAGSCPSSTSACREVPDISVDGDPATGYIAYYLGAWRTVGGSSVSAPTFAALVALADASAACGGHSIGFLNPALYRAAAGGYAADFRDITSGNNSYDSVPGFAAAAGYDMASGLGEPTAALGGTLCGVSITLRAPRAKTAVAGRFDSLQLAASSAPGEVISYFAAGLPIGLAINHSTGKISGTPKKAGKWRVTVTSTTSVGGNATTSFIWTVKRSRSKGRGSKARRASRRAKPGRAHHQGSKRS